MRRIHSNWASYKVLYEKHGPSVAGTGNFKHPGAVCGARCMRECFIHLEKQGKLQNEFHTDFRIRPPWRLDPDKLDKERYGHKDEDQTELRVDYSSDKTK